MKLSGLLLSMTLVVPLAVPLRASLPPDEEWRSIGTDSRGKSWTLLILRTSPAGPRPARLAGDVTVEIPLEPRVGEPRIWTLDASDRLWVFSEEGRGFMYDIPSRKLQHLAIPVKQQVSASLSVRGNTLWFQEFDPAVGSSVSSWLPGDAAVKRIFIVPIDMNMQGYALSPSTLWVAATGRGGPKRPILRAAVDLGSGTIVARFRATVTGDLESEAGSRLLVDGDACWITHPASGRIDRLERSGAQRSWSIAPYAPSDHIITPGRTVVIGRKGKWKTIGPEGPWQNQWKTTSCRIFVMDPKRPEVSASSEVDVRLCGAALSVGSDGTVRLGTAAVRLDSRQPRIEGQ